MIRLSEIRMPPSHTEAELFAKVRNTLGLSEREPCLFRIAKRSLDARRKSDIHYLYAVELELAEEGRFLSRTDVVKAEPYSYDVPTVRKNAPRPIVVGSGPAGLFAALALARAGLKPIVLERGRPVEERVRDVEAFFSTGVLNESSNVLFGEGGAGTFSDGKLQSGIRDPRRRFILEELASAGAPPEILYDAKPHIGTDRLRGVLLRLREEIERLGGEYRFSHTFCGFEADESGLLGLDVSTPSGKEKIPCERAVLATGHSARDTYSILFARGIGMAAKPFSVGVRIEHRQQDIDRSQYGGGRDGLPPSDYRLSAQLENGRGAYTFCMCPGGTVLSASSEAGYLATNGMSNFLRDGENANSALLIGVDPEDFGDPHPLAGIAFQRMLESRAFLAGGSNYRAPAQRVGDFLKRKVSKNFSISPTYRPGVVSADLREILPSFVAESIALALPEMGKKLHAFQNPDAVLTAVESRSSSPVRILRSERLESNVGGLYPCGEGGGHAGGILSAAVDGVRCAEQILACYL